MKQFPALIFLVLVGLWSSRVQATNFSPFQPGATYQYSQTGADSLYTLRLDKYGYTQGSDSVYSFNFRVGSGLTSFSGTSCRNFRYADNLFGGQLKTSGAGTMQATYRLVFGDYPGNGTYFGQYILRPRYPLNQPWSLEGFTNGITARVTARGIATVLGQTDSVVTITFSTGKVLRLSKNFGLVEGPPLCDYILRAPARMRQLTLSALPGRRMGQYASAPQAIYDFQPGDTFWYRAYDNNPTPFRSYSYYYVDSVMMRTASRTGDTLTYRIQRCAPQSQSQPNFYQYTLVVSSRQPSPLTFNTDEYIPESGQMGGVLRAGMRLGQWNNRFNWFYRKQYSWPVFGMPLTDSLCVVPPNADRVWDINYVAGLGQISSFYMHDVIWNTSFYLTGYRKGTETWGSTPRLVCRMALATSANHAAATTTAAPNPFNTELTITFALEQPQAVVIELRDALGRIVRRQPATSVSAGPQRLVLSTAGLPAGLYMLHLLRPAEGRTEVLKVVKAE